MIRSVAVLEYRGGLGSLRSTRADDIALLGDGVPVDLAVELLDDGHEKLLLGDLGGVGGLVFGHGERWMVGCWLLWVRDVASCSGIGVEVVLCSLEVGGVLRSGQLGKVKVSSVSQVMDKVLPPVLD